MAPKPTRAYRFGECSADANRLEVRRGGRVVALEPKAMRVLFHLIENRDRVVTKEELIAHIWAGAFVTDSVLTRVVAQLRKQLGDDAHHPRYIETAATAGYRFIADVEADGLAAEAADIPRSRGRLLAATAILIVLVGIAVWWLRQPNMKTAGTIRAVRQLTNSGAADLFPSFSPDGSQIVFSSNRTGHFELYIRSLAPGSAERQITFGGQDVIQPAWSPDGQYLAYALKEGGIAVMPVSGGPVRYLAAVGSGPQWSPDGRMLAYAPFNVASVSRVNRTIAGPSQDHLMLVEIDGGPPRELTYPGDPLAVHSNSRWLGDGRHLLFGVNQRPWVMDLRSGQTRMIDLGNYRMEFFVPSPDGQALYFTTPEEFAPRGLWRTRIDGNWRAQKMELLMPVAGPLTTGVAISTSGSRLAFSQQIGEDGIWSVPIDPSGAPRGEPKALVQDFSVRNMEPDFSQDGSMIAYASIRQGEKAAVSVANADGSGAQGISPTGVNCQFPTWLGPERCEYRCYTPGADFWIAPLRGPPRRLNTKLKYVAGMWPRIARDGTKVVSHLRDTSTRRLRLVLEDLRSGETRDLTPRDRSIGYGIWSPDGRWIAAEEERGAVDSMVLVSPNDGRISTLVHEPVHSWPNDWAPNNDQVVFAGQRNGVWNVYWVSRSTGRVQQLTHFQSQSGFVRYPSWSPRGDRVIFEREDLSANIYLVDLR